MIRALWASICKEGLLLVRDWHALLVLFAMPTLFVLIMSLALQGRFADHQQAQLPGWISNDSPAPGAAALMEELSESPALALALAQTQSTPELSLQKRFFWVHITEEFEQAFNGEGGVGVLIHFAPELPLRDQILVRAAVQEAFAYFSTTLIAEEMGYDRDYARTELLKEGLISVVVPETRQRPNSVQQNVPAWLIFAMFVVAIPISTTVIQERQQRTMMRLQMLGVPLAIVHLGKLVPYFLINQLQLMAMLAIGRWVLPLLGAQALSLDVSLAGLAWMGCSTSVAALGLASLIASAARSLEQATVISGAMSILFAALGGIMIPRFVMPPLMQDLALLSPMAWALEGFLTVLVRGGGFADVMADSAVLWICGILAGIVSIGISRGRKNHE